MFLKANPGDEAIQTRGRPKHQAAEPISSSHRGIGTPHTLKLPERPSL